ncbi:DNA polymerase eta-like [Homarus americanus]|uniref:DNA polymerase eta-like n=1 Tax=Homarus americanus TaxID=6706 RepID=A0A8J5JKH4_HOMAM|nr:DNA polymerase eta-like [Homarus americanus]
MTERVVVLLDMDCFYVQVEERDHPHIKGVPAAVVQYNTWKGGGIIAVNYEARGFGVKRGMRGDEARAKCPNIQLVQVPVSRGKADLTKYRNAGKEVINVLCDFSDCIERASIDEAYIDFTNVIEQKLKEFDGNKISPENLMSTWVVGYDKTEEEDKQMNKDLLSCRFWLHNLGKGSDSEPVTSRQLPKSIGCGKNFQGKEALNTREKVQKWMRSLADELSERLDIDQSANKRRAKTLTVSVRLDSDERWCSLSRSCGLPSYSAERITRLGISLIQHTNQASPRDPGWTPVIKHIGLSAGKFEDWEGASSGNIQDMFKKAAMNKSLRDEKLNSSTCNDGMPEHSDSGSFKPVTVECSSKISETSVCTSYKSCENTDKMENDVPSRSSWNNKINEQSVLSPDSTEHIPEVTKDSHEISSKSFFKNFLLRKKKYIEINSTDFTRERDGDESEILYNDDNSEKTQKEAENSDENDLDLLVSFIDEEESECSRSSESVTASDKKSGVKDSTATQDKSVVCESPDLFGSQDSEGSGKMILEDKDRINKNDSEKIRSTHKGENQNEKPKPISDGPTGSPLENNLLEKPVENNTTSCGQELHKDKNVQNSKISAKELFPNLDNYDESLLPLLPQDLRLEVERELIKHKNKQEKQFAKKLEILKYVNGSPSKRHIPTEVKNDSNCKPINPQCSEAHAVAGPSNNALLNHSNISSKKIESKQMCYSTLDEDTTGNKIAECGNFGENKSNITDSSDNIDTVECDECGCQISAFELPEHLDYHVALKLQTDIQRDMNIVPKQGTAKAIVMENKKSKGKKRGRTSKAEKYLEGKGKKNQKLDVFFKR